MSNNTKTKKLSGIVLILILTIMFVLMVMLFASLTVVSTAKNRTYLKFEQNQAYYTARSALDLYTDSLLTDSHYNSGTMDYIKKVGATEDKKTVDLKQGRALELDLYDIAVVDDSGNVINDWWVNAKSTDSVFSNDYDTPRFEIDCENFEVDKANLKYIEYQVDLPATGSNKGDYGKLVDGTGTDTKATIKIEVLDRLYNTAEGYTAEQFQAAPSKDIDAMKKAINEGDRAKDYFKVKVTSTTEFMGVEGVAVLEYCTDKPEIKDSDNAMSSFGGIAAGGGNDLTIVGGAATAANMRGKDGRIYGELFAEKDYHDTINSAAFPLYDNEIFYVGGDFTWASQSNGMIGKEITEATNRPLVYIGGTLGKNIDNFKEMDGTFYNSNYTCPNAINLTRTNDLELVDIVCHGFVAPSNGTYISGNVVCNGDMDLTNSAANVKFDKGVVLVNGKLTMPNNNTTGVFYTTQEFEIPLGWGSTWPANVTVYAPSFKVDPNSTITAPSTIISGTDLANEIVASSILGQSIDTATTAQINKLDSPDEIEITLPSKCEVTGGKTRLIPTHLSTYGQYYKPNPNYISETETPTETKYEINGDGRVETGTAIDKLNNPPEYYIFSSREEAAGRKKATDIAGNDEPQYEEMDFAAPADAMLAENQISWVDQNDKSDKTIVQNGVGNYYFQPKTGTQEIEINISGGGTVNLFLVPGTYRGPEITIADDTTVNFYMDSSNQTNAKIIWNMKVITEKIKDISGDIHFSDDPYNYEAPKVHYYIHENVDLECIGDSGSTLFTGYIYAPDTTFTFPNATAGHDAAGKYRAENVSEKFISLGSIVAEDINTGGNAAVAVAFLDPDATAAKPGDPMFIWSPTQYSRY